MQDTLSCVAKAKITLSEGGYTTVGRVHGLTLNRNEAVKPKGAHHLLLRVQMQYEIVPVDEPGRDPWRVTTRAYNHEVQNSSGEGVVSYHWHPQSRVKDPHVHLGHTQLAKDVVLHNKLHIPTARLSLEGVIRHCIEELQVKPLRDDWDPVLATRKADFEAFRKWNQSPPAPTVAPKPDAKNKPRRPGKRRSL
ncbi:hypothetical protein [Spirillospora albida]|uniref:hypothetical protein n=1 Tax=Spirillospora albida TaxID=58123 RepID=UPI0012F7B132|nr:hypothetical protein [Spirillospora albida]